MFIGGMEVLVLLAMLATIGLLVVALINLVKRPAEVWEASGQSQIVWALVVVLVGFIGPILYLVIARPALDDAASSGHAFGAGL